jgi:hypothetical protein
VTGEATGTDAAEGDGCEDWDPHDRNPPPYDRNLRHGKSLGDWLAAAQRPRGQAGCQSSIRLPSGSVTQPNRPTPSMS